MGFPGLTHELARGGERRLASHIVGRLYESVHSARSLYLHEGGAQDVEKVLDTSPYARTATPRQQDHWRFGAGLLSAPRGVTWL